MRDSHGSVDGVSQPESIRPAGPYDGPSVAVLASEWWRTETSGNTC